MTVNTYGCVQDTLTARGNKAYILNGSTNEQQWHVCLFMWTVLSVTPTTVIITITHRTHDDSMYNNTNQIFWVSEGPGGSRMICVKLHNFDVF